MPSPASLIYLAESADNITRDHFHPFYWGAPPEVVSGFMNNLTWNAALGVTKELALERHQGGFNVIYADGHAKWYSDEASLVLAQFPEDTGRSTKALHPKAQNCPRN